MILNLFYFFMVELNQKALILHIWIVFVVMKECRHALSPPSKNYGFRSTCQSKVNEKKLSHLREKKIHKKCKGPQTKWCCRFWLKPGFWREYVVLKSLANMWYNYYNYSLLIDGQATSEGLLRSIPMNQGRVNSKDENNAQLFASQDDSP